jgi:hypothetical protein
VAAKWSKESRAGTRETQVEGAKKPKRVTGLEIERTDTRYGAAVEIKSLTVTSKQVDHA